MICASVSQCMWGKCHHCVFAVDIHVFQPAFMCSVTLQKFGIVMIKAVYSLLDLKYSNIVHHFLQFNIFLNNYSFDAKVFESLGKDYI